MWKLQQKMLDILGTDHDAMSPLDTVVLGTFDACPFSVQEVLQRVKPSNTVPHRVGCKILKLSDLPSSKVPWLADAVFLCISANDHRILVTDEAGYYNNLISDALRYTEAENIVVVFTGGVMHEYEVTGGELISPKLLDHLSTQRTLSKFRLFSWKVSSGPNKCQLAILTSFFKQLRKGHKKPLGGSGHHFFGGRGDVPWDNYLEDESGETIGLTDRRRMTEKVIDAERKQREDGEYRKGVASPQANSIKQRDAVRSLVAKKEEGDPVELVRVEEKIIGHLKRWYNETNRAFVLQVGGEMEDKVAFITYTNWIFDYSQKRTYEEHYRNVVNHDYMSPFPFLNLTFHGKKSHSKGCYDGYIYVSKYEEYEAQMPGILEKYVQLKFQSIPLLCVRTVSHSLEFPIEVKPFVAITMRVDTYDLEDDPLGSEPTKNAAQIWSFVHSLETILAILTSNPSDARQRR